VASTKFDFGERKRKRAFDALGTEEGKQSHSLKKEKKGKKGTALHSPNGKVRWGGKKKKKPLFEHAWGWGGVATPMTTFPLRGEGKGI